MDIVLHIDFIGTDMEGHNALCVMICSIESKSYGKVTNSKFFCKIKSNKKRNEFLVAPTIPIICIFDPIWTLFPGV